MKDFLEAFRDMRQNVGSRWRRKSWPRGVYIRSHQQGEPGSAFPYCILLVMGELRAPWEPAQEDLWALDWLNLEKEFTSCSSTKP